MVLTNKVYIVGAGSGDPDLITVKGLKILQQADVVIYADSLVNEELIAKAKSNAKVLKSSGMDLEEQVALMSEEVRQGKSVARVHTGDPAIYGAILEQMVLLRETGTPYEIIPGVSAIFAAASQVQAELTVPELTQTVIITRIEGRTPVPETEKLRALASHHTTIALYLSSGMAEKVTSELLAAGWQEDTPIAVVYRATWSDQKIIRTNVKRLASDLAEAGITKHAIILAGKALDPELVVSKAHQSKLYDKHFTHGYRAGKGKDE